MISSQTDSTRADEEAAQWAVLLREGGLSPHRLKEYSDWVAKDPTHLDRIEAYRRLYSRLDVVLPDLVDQGSVEDAAPAPARKSVVPLRRILAGAACAAVVAIASFWWIGLPETYATHSAKRESATLADGSVVDLNASTSLQVSLNSSERRVKLVQGEAFFSVQSDPGRPFVVETASGTVRVLGTRFNVRAVTPTSMEVTVVDGAVSVAPSGRTAGTRLGANDRLAFHETGAEFCRLSDTAVSDAIAWRDGRAIFVAEPLPAAAERFAVYHGRRIEVAPSLAHLELGGRFRLDDLDQFLTDIAVSLPVTVLKAGSGKIRIVPR